MEVLHTDTVARHVMTFFEVPGSRPEAIQILAMSSCENHHQQNHATATTTATNKTAHLRLLLVLHPEVLLLPSLRAGVPVHLSGVALHHVLAIGKDELPVRQGKVR